MKNIFFYIISYHHLFCHGFGGFFLFVFFTIFTSLKCVSPWHFCWPSVVGQVMEVQHSPSGDPDTVIQIRLAKGVVSVPTGWPGYLASYSGIWVGNVGKLQKESQRSVSKNVLFASVCFGFARVCVCHSPVDRVISTSGSLCRTECLLLKGKSKWSITYITIPICHTVVGSGS